MHSTPYSYPTPIRRTRRSFGWLFSTLLVLLLSALTGLIQLHTYYTYQTYQQGSCTVTNGTTEYHSSKSGSYYTADLQYTVQANNGQQADTSGYSAPYQEQFSTQEEAQQVVNSYNVGQIYACMYNPADPSHAALVFQGYTFNNFVTDALITGFSFFFGFGFLWLLFYYGFYQQMRLIRHGVLSEGRVIEHFTRRSKNRTIAYSRIVFSPLGDPTQTYKVEAKGTYTIDSLQPICYDPKNPKNAKYGERPGGGNAAFTFSIVFIGVLVTGFILLSIWNRA